MPAASRRAGLSGLAVILVAACAAYCAVWIRSVDRQPAHDLGATFDAETLEILSLQPSGPAEQGGLKRHDRLTAIDGNPVRSRLELFDRLRDKRPGQVVRLSVILAGLNLPRTEEVVLGEWERGEPRSWVGAAAHGLLRSVPLMLLAVAALVLLRRPDRREAWLMALVTAGVIATAPLASLHEKIPPELRGPMVGFKLLFAAAAPALLYYLLAVFPERSSLDRRYPKLKEAWLGGSIVVALPFVLWGLMSSAAGPYQGAWPAVGRWLIAVSWVAALGAGIFALWQCVVDARSEKIARRARMVGAGLGAALVPAALLQLAALIGGSRIGDLSPGLRLPALLALLLLPAAVGYAVVARDPLPVGILIRREARTMLVGRGALVVLWTASAFVAIALADLATRSTAQRALLGSVFAAVGCGTLGWAGLRLHRRVAPNLDRMLFPSVWWSQSMLDELPGRLAFTPGTGELTQTLERELGKALRPVSLAVYLRTGEDRLTVQCGNVPAGMDEVLLDAPLPHADDEGKERPRQIEIGALDRIVQVGSDCLLPILGRQPGLLGLIVIGARRSGEPYSREDKRRLAAVATQAGLTLERIGSESAVA